MLSLRIKNAWYSRCKWCGTSVCSSCEDKEGHLRRWSKCPIGAMSIEQATDEASAIIPTDKDGDAK